MRLRKLIDFNLTAEHLEKMFGPSNELTIKSWEKRWMENIVENLNLHPEPRTMKGLFGQITRHTSLCVGAGWTLNKLRRHAPNIPPYWGIVVPDHSLIPVLQAGLKPTLVISMDGHQETEPMILDGFRMLNEMHPETPVLLDLVCCPSVVEMVKEPYFFRSCGDPAHILGRYVMRECPHIDQIGHGGNVGSVGLIMAKFMMFSRHIVLIGQNFSMVPGTTKTDYWFHREMPDHHAYVEVCDIYGRPTWTMANLHNYKWWMEHFCYTNDSVEWINCNDGGFLGVCSPSENYNHFKYMTLDKAIDYLKGHDEFDD